MVNKEVRVRGSSKVRKYKGVKVLEGGKAGKWEGENVRRCERRESGKVGKYEGEELGRRW